MALFTCPKCDGRGTKWQLTIDWDTRVVSAEPVLKLCPQCEGTGIVDNEGNSRQW